MDVNYQALKDLVQGANFEVGEELLYSGVSFLLFPCEYQERERIEGVSPVFSQPSSIADWDIYFSTNVVDRKFRKPVLLHEILEAEQFAVLQEDGLNRIEAGKRAHETARVYDDKLAQELFDNQGYKEYCTFRKGLLKGSK